MKSFRQRVVAIAMTAFGAATVVIAQSGGAQSGKPKPPASSRNCVP